MKPDTLLEQVVESPKMGLYFEEYTLLTKGRTGLLTSAAVPGFEIPIRAIFDRTENQKALQGITKAET